MEERKREGKGLQLTRIERCKTQMREGEGIDHGIARITRTHSHACVYTRIMVCSGRNKEIGDFTWEKRGEDPSRGKGADGAWNKTLQKSVVLMRF